MWIGLNDGWLSIVANRNDDETLLVRARSESHIMSAFPDCDMFVLKNADYPYRAYIERHRVAQEMVKRVIEIEYDNFKASVRDEKLHDMYTNMWQECYSQYIDERVLA
jgi:hypothetical protein